MRQIYLIAACTLLAVNAPAYASNPYLADGNEPKLELWLPKAPADNSISEATDLNAYFSTRPEVGAARGKIAADDNVYTAADVVLRFGDALGFALNAENAPNLVAMMDRVTKDSELMLKPIKQPVANGGRVRPYGRFGSLAACPHEIDDQKWGLNASGSYPSGHATLGWLWGLMLSELVPDKSDTVMAKAYEFGESRLICGFHYPSDLVAGRLAASSLMAKLHANPDFQKDLDKAMQEIAKAKK